jgi:2-methylaconitate cis-trans-isomerase PrpF
MTGIESPEQIDADDALKQRMDAIRAVVAERCGLRDYWRSRLAPSTPMLMVIGRPADYRTCTQGEPVLAGQIDLTIRQFASGSASKTLAGTLAATSGIACALPGSLPHRLVGTARQARVLAFGHPSGVMHVQADIDARDPLAPTIRRLAVQRTARCIAEGRVFLKQPID